jgi:hypothetical protein
VEQDQQAALVALVVQVAVALVVQDKPMEVLALQIQAVVVEALELLVLAEAHSVVLVVLAL